MKTNLLKVISIMENENQTKQLYKNLVLLAASDGIIAPEEEELLARVRDKYALPENLKQDILDKKDGIRLTTLKDSKEKFLNLFAMIDMICVDKQIESKEKQLTEKLALGLGFKANFLNRLIEYIIKYRLEGYSNSEIYKKLKVLKTISFI